MLPTIQVVDAQEAHLAIEVNYDVSLWFYACEQLASSVDSARVANALGRIDAAVGKDTLHAVMLPLLIAGDESRSTEERWREKNLFHNLERPDLVSDASEVIEFNEAVSSSYCRAIWPAARANAEMYASAIRNAMELAHWPTVEAWMASVVGMPVSSFPRVNVFLVSESVLVERGGVSFDFRLPSGENAYVAIVDVGNKDILEVLEIAVHEILHLVDSAAADDRLDNIRSALGGQSIFRSETIAHGLVVAISECAVRKYWSSTYLGRSHDGVAGFRRDDIAIWEAYVYGRAAFFDPDALLRASDVEEATGQPSILDHWMLERGIRMLFVLLSGDSTAAGAQRPSDGIPRRILPR